MANQANVFPPSIRRGKRLTAKDLNQISDASFLQNITGSGGVRVKTFGNRLVVEGDSTGGGRGRVGSNVVVKRLTYQSMQNDYLVCIDENSVQHLVAKPYLLRRTPFDGLTRDGISYSYSTTVTRTATQGAESESQVIVPSYVVGDEILAMRGVFNGTGIVNAPWIDINADGRAWAQEL